MRKLQIVRPAAFADESEMDMKSHRCPRWRRCCFWGEKANGDSKARLL